MSKHFSNAWGPGCRGAARTAIALAFVYVVGRIERFLMPWRRVAR